MQRSRPCTISSIQCDGLTCGIPLPSRVGHRGNRRRRVRRRHARPGCATSSRRKGLFVLSLQPKGAVAGVSLSLPQRRTINTARVSGLQPGAGDAAEGRHAAGAVARSAEAAGRRRRCSRRCSTTCTSRCGRARRCRTPSPRTATCSRASTRASLLAGERSGNLDAVLRRFVEYTKIIATVKRKTISALVYPAILISLALVLVVDHRAEGRAGVLGLLRGVRRRAAADHADHRAASRTFMRAQFLLLIVAARRRGRRRRRAGCGSPGRRRASIA